jgi:hypothetical protein
VSNEENGTSQTGALLIKDQPFSEYQKIDALNHSTLKVIERSPAHCFASKINAGRPSTAAMRRGNLVQAFVQGERFVRWDGERRTKAGKEEYEALCLEHGINKVITADEYDQAEGMSAAVLGHPVAGSIWGPDHKADIIVEPTILFEHTSELLGQGKVLQCKARPDAVLPASCTLIDLKTTTDASPGAFERKVFEYSMHTQLEYYRIALAQCGYDIKHALLVAVEDEPPYAVAVYRVTDDVLKLANGQLTAWLNKYCACTRMNRWPAYDPGVVDIGLPAWAVRKIEEQI